jgi:hypothetical protein
MAEEHSFIQHSTVSLPGNITLCFGAICTTKCILEVGHVLSSSNERLVVQHTWTDAMLSDVQAWREEGSYSYERES